MSHGDYKFPILEFDLSLAMEEANRCVLCIDAPCSQGCPGDTKPGEFIRKLRMQNITGAIRTIKANNILGGSCGVLCPVEALCEKECSTKALDRPIKIGQIQKALIEHSWDLGFRVYGKPTPGPHKVAVVGSGPAGLSCAAELAKTGVKVTIFEAKPKPGGILRYGIPSFRYPEIFLEKELEDIEFLGVEIKCSSPITGKQAVEDLLQQGFDAVFAAPGLWRSARLEKEPKDIDGVQTAIRFLEDCCCGKQDLSCKPFEGKAVAVIGGGSTSMDCAETAVKLGAKDVYLVYRRSFTQMLAVEEEKTRVLQQGVHFLLLNQPKEFVTGPGGKLKGLKMVRTRLGEPDQSGRRRPMEIPGSEWVLDTDIVIEAIGTKPEADSPQWYPGVKLKDNNKVDADPETGATSVEGIFAGGDIIPGAELVIKAVQDGKNSAKAIKDYLEKRRN
jgi:NADPH-dependent glutamate synthase beta subunit-like oxidoreductase